MVPADVRWSLAAKRTKSRAIQEPVLSVLTLRRGENVQRLADVFIALLNFEL